MYSCLGSLALGSFMRVFTAMPAQVRQVKLPSLLLRIINSSWGCLPRLIHLLMGESEGLSESLACLKTGISVNCDTLPLEFTEAILNFSLCHFLFSLSTGNASGTAIGLYLDIERASHNFVVQHGCTDLYKLVWGHPEESVIKIASRVFQSSFPVRAGLSPVVDQVSYIFVQQCLEYP